MKLSFIFAAEFFFILQINLYNQISFSSWPAADCPAVLCLMVVAVMSDSSILLQTVYFPSCFLSIFHFSGILSKVRQILLYIIELFFAIAFVPALLKAAPLPKFWSFLKSFTTFFSITSPDCVEGSPPAITTLMLMVSGALKSL